MPLSDLLLRCLRVGSFVAGEASVADATPVISGRSTARSRSDRHALIRASAALGPRSRDRCSEEARSVSAVPFAARSRFDRRRSTGVHGLRARQSPPRSGESWGFQVEAPEASAPRAPLWVVLAALRGLGQRPQESGPTRTSLQLAHALRRFQVCPYGSDSIQSRPCMVETSGAGPT